MYTILIDTPQLIVTYKITTHVASNLSYIILKTKEDLESQDIKRSSIITFTKMSFCEKLQVV
jgi:hypothetical protein